MTTIAYKQGVIACDNQMTYQGVRYRAPYKLQKRERFVYVVTGEIAPGLTAVDCIDRGEPDDRPEAEYSIFQMCRRTGRLWEWEHVGERLPILEKFHAVGSGSHLALGAMAAGATPGEAIRIACAWDVHSGFGVQEFRSDKART